MNYDVMEEIILNIFETDRCQNITITILLGLVLFLFAFHLIDDHFTNKRIEVLEEEMKKLGEVEKDE